MTDPGLENLRRLSAQVAAAMPPESVRRVMEEVAKALPPAQVPRLAEDIAFAFPPESVRRRLSKQLAELLPSQDMRRLSEQVAINLPSEDLRRLAEQVTQTYPMGNVQRLTEQLASSYQASSLGRFRSAVDLQAASERLETEVSDAGGDQKQRLGAWLASRSLPVQAALLCAGLQVLDAFSKLIEEASGEDIPDILQVSTAACFALVAFLLVLINEQNKPSD